MGFTNLTVAGLKLWLKADTGVTLSGSDVTAWADQSGNGNDYVQATSGKQPTVTASAINGLPAVTFDGSSQFLTSSFQIGGAKTVILVRKLVSTPGASSLFDLYSLKDASNVFADAMFINDAGYQPYSLLHGLVTTGSPANAVGDATTLDTSWHMGMDTYDGSTNTSPSSYAVSLDAVSQSVVTSGAFNRSPSDLASLGARSSSANVGTFFAPIEIAEVLVYDHVLSGGDLTAVRAYIAAKYFPGSLAISPSSITMDPGMTQTFVGSAGTAPYTYSISTNNSGGTINSTTGVYVPGFGNPFSAITDIVTVTDALSATADATVNVNKALIISPTAAGVLAGDDVSFISANGSGSGYTYAITVNNSGASIVDHLDGTADYFAGTTTGVSDTVVLTDSIGGTATCVIDVRPALAVTPPTTVTVSVNGSYSFTSTGGATPLDWEFDTNTSGGFISNGGPHGSIGNYIAGPTAGTDIVFVQDNDGNQVFCTINVVSMTIVPDTVTVPPLGSQGFTVTGGTGPFTYALTVNNSGATLIDNGDGTASYTAGSSPSCTDVVEVTDSLSNISDATITVGPGVTLSPSSVTKPPGGSQTFTASGGSGTGFVYSFSFNGSGGTINASSGAYVAGNVADNDQIIATDSLGNVSPDTTVTIPGVGVTPSSASAAPLQHVNFSASGGSGTGYTWAIPVNNSGASINSSGHYVAGATGSVSDLVQATDSLGNTSTGVVVTVGAVLAISPSTATVGPRVGFTFTASGGSGVGTTFSFVHNNSGGTLNSSTGAYVAGTTGSRVDTVRVVDNSGAHADAVVTVGPNLTIAPANSTINKGSARTFTHGGGSGSGITFSLTQNQSGATLNSSTGAYTAGFGGGIPAVDIILVSDDVGNTASATVSAYPPNFYVQGVTLIGLSTLRVKFSYPPKAVDPTATNDALHPANYVLVGNDITYVITCIPVVGDESSIDCLMAAPFGFGKWTLSVSNIQSADGGQTL